MKKLLISLSLMVTLSVFAQTPGTISQRLGFLTAPTTNGYVVLTNNTTTRYDASGVFYLSPQGVPAGSSTNYTYFISGTSNLFVSGISYYGGSWYTNSTLTNGIGLLYPRAWEDVDMYSDKNGNPASVNISITAATDTLNSTNMITLEFARVADGYNVATTAGNSLNLMTMAFPLTGVTNNTFMTNLPSMFVYGTRKIRLNSIKTENSTTNLVVYIKAVNLSGFVP